MQVHMDFRKAGIALLDLSHTGALKLGFASKPSHHFYAVISHRGFRFDFALTTRQGTSSTQTK